MLMYLITWMIQTKLWSRRERREVHHYWRNGEHSCHKWKKGYRVPVHQCQSFWSVSPQTEKWWRNNAIELIEFYSYQSSNKLKLQHQTEDILDRSLLLSLCICNATFTWHVMIILSGDHNIFRSCVLHSITISLSYNQGRTFLGTPQPQWGQTISQLYSRLYGRNNGGKYFLKRFISLKYF